MYWEWDDLIVTQVEEIFHDAPNLMYFERDAGFCLISQLNVLSSLNHLSILQLVLNKAGEILILLSLLSLLADSLSKNLRFLACLGDDLRDPCKRDPVLLCKIFDRLTVKYGFFCDLKLVIGRDLGPVFSLFSEANRSICLFCLVDCLVKA